MNDNAKLRFSRRLVYLKGRLIDFDDRPYLPALYGSEARNLVVKSSRQTEKSTYLALTILYWAVTRPGISILFVCPRTQQAQLFSKTRLIEIINNSPILRDILIGTGRKLPVNDIVFANRSLLHVRAAFHSADAVRGISADLVLVDECQDVAAGDLPVILETLSHSEFKRAIFTGTPKLVDNHLEAMFAQSTANEWTITCPGCGKGVILDERSLGPTGIACPDSAHALDKYAGRWVPRNPGATWGDGYWVNHLMTPWKKNYDEILENQRVYDRAKFKNEVLGLATVLGEHVVTRAELEACCSDRPMAKSPRDFPAAARGKIVAGIDWGGGGASRTAVAIGWMRPDYVFEVGAFYRIRADEDTNQLIEKVSQLMRDFNVSFFAADGGGNGYHLNRVLLGKLNPQIPLYAILYSASDQPPSQDGALWRWVVNRSSTIGTLFSRVKKKQIVFPRSEDCGSFLDEFACELAVYDDINRTIKYTHPETMQDDAMHAANYAVLLGTRQFNAPTLNWCS